MHGLSAEEKKTQVLIQTRGPLKKIIILSLVGTV